VLQYLAQLQPIPSSQLCFPALLPYLPWSGPLSSISYPHARCYRDNGRCRRAASA
jgi:hypothetical protein